MYEAARVTDPVCHTSALAGFLVGALIGIALIAAVAFATFTCGFGVALLAGLVAGVGASAILSVGESIGASHTSRTGAILIGSPNTFTNSLASAFVQGSTVQCDKHAPVNQVAEGSSNVFINSLPSARKKDAITCGAKIDDGSKNVYIGGGTVRYLPVDEEVPPWLRTAVDWAFALAGLAGGLAGLLKAAGGLSKAVLPCAAKFIGGFVLGEAAGRYVIGPAVESAVGGLFGHPVDVTTGRKLLLAQREVDHVVASPIPVEIQRFYASNLAFEGPLGRGWVLPWDLRLQPRDGMLWYTDSQGRESGFPVVPPGQVAFSETEQRWLACTADGRYVLHDLSEMYVDFGMVDLAKSDIAWVQRIEDQTGQWIAYQRDGTGRVDTIRTSGGVQLQCYYLQSQGRLTGIECTVGGARGLLVQYGYDEHGQLAQVTNANGEVTRRFAYRDHLMTSHVNALGFECRYVWADIDGLPRVVETSTSEGETARFTYDVPGRRTVVTDDLGRTAGWRYDEQFRIVESMDLDGSRYGIEYDAAGQPTVLHLPGDRRAMFEYDTAGRIVKETDPLGRVTLTQYAGTGLRVTEKTLPDGSRWRANYDLQGRLLRTVDPLGRVERWEYAEGLSPLPLAHVDARGGRRTMTWNRLGLLTSSTDCSAKTTHYEHDMDGHVAARTNALDETVRYRRLRTGEPVDVTLPDGQTEHFEYDAAGLLRLHRNPIGQTRRWSRNARGQVTQALDAAERSLVYRYDPHGRLTELSSANGARYRFAYDAGDRLLTELRPDGIERHFAYRDIGDLETIRTLGVASDGTRAERWMRFQRDPMSRLLAQTTDTAVTAFTWDAGDRLKQAERTPTPEGETFGVNASTVAFDYDIAGRLLAEHGADGNVNYELDELDQLTTLALPHGQRIDTLTYGSGHVHQIRSGEQIVSDFERDDLHREVLRTQGELTQRVGYDPLGRRTWQSAGTANDVLGPGQGRLWRSYRYDTAGELAEQRDNLRGATSYGYDPAGELLRATRKVDRTQEQFAWDAAGNLLDAVSRKSAGSIVGNRLHVWQDIRFAYDAWGNVATKRRGTNQTQTFRFDADNRLIAVTTQGARGTVETRFEYDALGRRIARHETQTEASGGTPHHDERRFVWQGLRMAQEIRHSGVSAYVYSPTAAYTPIARLDAGLSQEAAAAHATDLAITAAAKSSTRVLHFHTDLVGAPLEVTDESGELAWAGRYKAWGAVERGEDAALLSRIEQPLRYPGQYADDSTGLHYNTFRYYDPDVGRFVNQDPIGLAGGENLYQYGHNPTRWADPLGWVGETVPGYNVYGLYDPGATKPYYVGITDDLARRRLEHLQTGRLDGIGEIRSLETNVSYGEARGFEQAYIEQFGTKTGTIGEEISSTNRGNKINSFDRSSKTRPAARQQYFESAYQKKAGSLKGGC